VTNSIRFLAASLVVAMLLPLPVRGAETGTIQGTIDKPGDVTAVFAIERFSKKMFPGKLDPKTGKFTIAGLPLEAKYDCIVDFAGARLEGVNVKVPRSEYEEEQPLSKEDDAKLRQIIKELNQFEDTIDILAVTGNIQHAAIVLNKRRIKPFYESKPGEIIWRLEVWRFEKPEETWTKVQDELFLIHYRERIQKTVYDKKSITLDPELGGLRLTKKQTSIDVGKVALPGKELGVKMRPVKPAPTEKKSED
jgi:hypothetical protein